MRKRLEIRRASGDEGQHPVVEHDAHGHRAELTAVLADSAAGAQDVALARSDRRALVDDVPAAARRAEVRDRVLGQVEEEAADQPAVGPVELDRRRDARRREVGFRPELIRRVGRCGFVGRLDQELAQRGQRVDFLAGAIEARLQVVPQPQCRRPVLLGDQPILGFGRERVQRRIHRQRRHDQRGEDTPTILAVCEARRTCPRGQPSATRTGADRARAARRSGSSGTGPASRVAVSRRQRPRRRSSCRPRTSTARRGCAAAARPRRRRAR